MIYGEYTANNELSGNGGERIGNGSEFLWCTTDCFEPTQSGTSDGST
jgi:hypothetical protein